MLTYCARFGDKEIGTFAKCWVLQVWEVESLNVTGFFAFFLIVENNFHLIIHIFFGIFFWDIEVDTKMKPIFFTFPSIG